MEKTYNSPRTLVVLIDTQDMVCASLPKGDESTVISNNDDVLSRERRGGSMWDDED